MVKFSTTFASLAIILLCQAHVLCTEEHHFRNEECFKAVTEFKKSTTNEKENMALVRLINNIERHQAEGLSKEETLTIKKEVEEDRKILNSIPGFDKILTEIIKFCDHPSIKNIEKLKEMNEKKHNEIRKKIEEMDDSHPHAKNLKMGLKLAENENLPKNLKMGFLSHIYNNASSYGSGAMTAVWSYWINTWCLGLGVLPTLPVIAIIIQ